jgi:hypothetical protein
MHYGYAIMIPVLESQQESVYSQLKILLALAPLQIQGQQLLQNLLIGQIGLPAIGGKDGFIEPLVCKFQPCRTSVDKVWEQEKLKARKCLP